MDDNYLFFLFQLQCARAFINVVTVKFPTLVRRGYVGHFKVQDITINLYFKIFGI